MCLHGAVPGAASAFIHFHCFQLVLGARCARPRRVLVRREPVPTLGRLPALPAAPAAPGAVSRRIHRVPVIFPGNLSFRRYTCAYLGGGATTERVFFPRVIFGLGFSELLSPPPNGEVGLFRLTF